MPFNFDIDLHQGSPVYKSIPDATTTSDGAMSAADKAKLDSLTPGGVTTLAGDVTGQSDNNTVSELQGVPLTATGASAGQALVYDGAAWVPGTVAGGGSAPLYGDGSDGAYVATAGTTTLSRDLVCETFTVGDGDIVVTNGYRIFATQSITIEGALLNFGFDGDASESGGGTGAGGAGGAAGTLGGGGNGGDGGSGGVNPGADGDPGDPAANGSGGDGSAGGNSNFASAGAGGLATPPVASLGAISSPPSVWGRMLDGSQWSGGGGGGGGGAKNDVGLKGAGGGGGGGCIFLAAPSVTFSATAVVSVSGGAGGSTPDENEEGGGGFGGGGRIVVIANDFSVSDDAFVSIASGFNLFQKATDGEINVVGCASPFSVPQAPNFSAVVAAGVLTLNFSRVSGMLPSYWNLGVWGSDPVDPNTTPADENLYFVYDQSQPFSINIEGPGTFYIAMRGIDAAGAGLFSSVVAVTP